MPAGILLKQKQKKMKEMILMMENPVNMKNIKWEKEPIDDDYGKYTTANPNLYNYLLDCGITPVSWTYESKYGKQKKVWTYRTSETLQYYINEFRKQDS